MGCPFRRSGTGYGEALMGSDGLPTKGWTTVG